MKTKSFMLLGCLGMLMLPGVVVAKTDATAERQRMENPRQASGLHNSVSVLGTVTLDAPGMHGGHGRSTQGYSREIED